MDIKINDELRAYIDPLNPYEYEALERSLLAEGCRDALVLWGDVLIDGHNRYDICRKHGIEFRTVQNDRFASIDDVMLWMIDNQLARRSVSDFQRGMLALRKKAILAERAKAQQDSEPDAAPADAPAADGQAPEQAAKSAQSTKSPKPPLATREEVAKIAGISSNAVSRIEKIQKTATPELVEAVRAGTISLNAAAAVATLPGEQQVAAVSGGKKELQQVARQVREAKSPPKPRAEVPAEPIEIPTDPDELRAKFEALHAENAALRAKVVALTIALKEARQAA
ncbi:hypothetical protein GCM10027343_20710 [Noviherbaspirillum agri]